MALPPDSDRVSAVDRAAAARVRADARLAGAIADTFLPDDARLDDRVRIALAQRLNDTVAGIEAELRRQGAKLLAARGLPHASDALLAGGGAPAAERLTRAGLLRDESLIAELIAQVGQDLLSAALPAAGPDGADGEGTSLLVRLAGVPDRVVAGAARALLVADSRGGSLLPADLQHRLVWWTAAAIRPAAPDPDADRALAEAATRSLGAHDESERGEAIATRLAAAIDARPEELAPLLIEALGDRRLSLFVAVLARAAGLDFEQTRALVLESDGERLWLALRAVALDRATIARIALTLSEADPRRDIEAFADSLDRIAAVHPHDARIALAPETLERDFRAAIAALARAGRR